MPGSLQNEQSDSKLRHTRRRGGEEKFLDKLFLHNTCGEKDCVIKRFVHFTSCHLRLSRFSDHKLRIKYYLFGIAENFVSFCYSHLERSFGHFHQRLFDRCESWC